LAGEYCAVSEENKANSDKQDDQELVWYKVIYIFEFDSDESGRLFEFYPFNHYLCAKFYKPLI